MPIYEYACEGCRDRFEARQKVSDPALTTCPKCGGALQKLISSPAIMFKGSGWYVTDYSDKLKPPGSSDTTGTPSTEKKKEGGTGSDATAPASPTPAPPASSSGTSSSGAPAAPATSSSSS